MVLDHYYYQLAIAISARQQVQLAVRQVAAIVQTVFRSDGFAIPNLSTEALEAAERLLAQISDPLFLLSTEGQELLHRHFAAPVLDSLDNLVGESTMAQTAARHATGQDRPVSPMVITPPPGSIAQDSPSPPTLPPFKRLRQGRSLGSIMGSASGPSSFPTTFPSSPAVSRTRSAGSQRSTALPLEDTLDLAESSTTGGQQLKKRKRTLPGGK